MVTLNPLSALLRESWGFVGDREALLAATCYARLFLSHPELRDHFPVTLDPAAGSSMWRGLVAMTLAAAEGGHEAEMASLGAWHRRYDVRPAHYDAVGAALVESLRIVVGDRWVPGYDEAWLGAFATAARTMLSGAAAATGPATWTAEVVRHERRGSDVACFTVRPDRPLRYRAGQYVSLECHHHPHLWRRYSVANAPRPDVCLDFQVRARDAGWVSGALVRRLRVGDLVRLADPAGAMQVDRQSTRDLVCVAGGTGLAPMRAVVEDLAGFNRTRWVHLFVGARRREDLYDLPALSALADRCPWLSVVPVCSDDPAFAGERGDVSRAVRRYGPWPRHDFLVAGPAGMIRSTLETLTGLGVDPDRITYDRPVLGASEALPPQVPDTRRRHLRQAGAPTSRPWSAGSAWSTRPAGPPGPPVPPWPAWPAGQAGQAQPATPPGHYRPPSGTRGAA